MRFVCRMRSCSSFARSRVIRRRSSSLGLGGTVMAQTRGSPRCQAISVRSSVSPSIASVWRAGDVEAGSRCRWPRASGEFRNQVTRNGKYTNVEYARFADDLVVLIHAYKRHDWLIGAVNKRLREEFAKLQVEINDEKSRRVELERGENFGFLGFDFRYLRGLRGVMRPHYTPKLKKRTALVRELKQVFRRHRSQPIERVISLINPMLRGWVNYFAVGNSSECFTYIRDWVEKKVRRHLAHARKQKGFGWERWSRPWLYDTLGLFNSYRVRHDGPKVAPVG